MSVQDRAGQDSTGQYRRVHDRTEQAKARQGRAGHSVIGQCSTEQDRAEQCRLGQADQGSTE